MHYPYPIRFHPIYKDYIWGGRGFAERFGRELPGDVIAESWEVASHPNGTSVVAEGELAGKTLPELIAQYGRDLMGSTASDSDLARFPLLLKFLDANDYLSVQVHPDDDYARIHENGELGKLEVWHVVAAEPGSKIVYGLKPGTSREDFIQSIREDRVQELLRFVEVRPGDTFSIPPGVVHSLGAGVMVIEVQQNSDAVYRVYDWGRVGADGQPRPLHIEKALDVIDFFAQPSRLEGRTREIPGGRCTVLVENKYFAAELLESHSTITGKEDGTRFELLTGLEGEASLEWQGGRVPFLPGTSYLLPAALGEFRIVGKCKALKSFVSGK